jgi:hypothetical protein
MAEDRSRAHETEIGHTITGGFPCITLTNPCVLLPRSSHRLSTRPLRRRNGVARSERGDGVVLPVELAHESVDFGATRKAEFSDMLLKQAFVDGCPAREAPAVLAPLDAVGDGQAFCSGSDLPFDDRKTMPDVVACGFHPRQQHALVGMRRHGRVLPDQTAKTDSSGMLSSASETASIDDAMSSPAIAPSISADWLPACLRPDLRPDPPARKEMPS